MNGSKLELPAPHARAPLRTRQNVDALPTRLHVAILCLLEAGAARAESGRQIGHGNRSEQPIRGAVDKRAPND
jgi:hypothetical protein